MAVMIAVAAVALIGLSAPKASAASTVPYFGPNVQVDQPPAYTAGTPSLAVGTNGVAYLAFAGWGGTTTQSDIFFTESADGGRTWTTPIRVNNDVGGAAQSEPALALDSSNNIYIVWTDARNGNNDVYSSKSTDGGMTFAANVRVNDVTTSFQQDPAIAVDPVDPNLVHVVWTDGRNTATTGPDIYYANSTDGGLSFNPSVRVNDDTGAAEQGQPAIAVAPDRSVYVVWTDPRNVARGQDIYFSKSTDLGATWSANIIVNDDTGAAAQQEPVIRVNEAGTVFIAWTDYRNPNTAPDIYATRSTNGGSSFAANVKINDDTGAVPQIEPSLAVNAGQVQVAWADYRTGGSTSYDIYTSSSPDGLTWSANMKVNDNVVTSDFQFQPSVAVDASGDVFAAWLDTRASGQDVFAATLDVVPPVADAGSAITVNQGIPASFSGVASSDNLGIAGYAWDFGDGTSGSGVTATHAYTDAGTYLATLTVWDYSGNSATSTVTVTVRDTQAPVPRGAGDRVVDEGQPLFFDASASTDNVGIVSYRWNFGDGSNATKATASHVYAIPGFYNVTLTVTDAAGNSATAAFTVTVRAVSPKPSDLLGMIQLLDGIVAILAIAVGFLAWMLLAKRRRQQPPSTTPSPMSAQQVTQPPSETPIQPPPPPTEPDPIDMTLSPPKEP